MKSTNNTSFFTPLGFTCRRHLFLLLLAIVGLSACGGNTRPNNSAGELAQALSQGDKAAIQRHLSTTDLPPAARALAEMRLMQMEKRPLPVAALSRELVAGYEQLNPAQQAILKRMTLWANAQPIYRQEIGRQVRILQREKLYLAPSHIDLARCANESPGCANALRRHLAALVDTESLNNTLMDMARRDPCINLTDQLQSDEKAHRCLRKQMGEIDVELLPAPVIPVSQWESALRR